MRVFFSRTLAIYFFLAGASALAHQQKQTITNILFNDRSGNLEVMHRFYIHDAEHAIKHLINKKADLVSSKESQQKFGHYLEKHFKLKINDGEPIRLNYVGHEVEGKFFWVYQEIELPKNIARLEMQQKALQEIWPSQLNLVNVENKGNVKSLEFDADDNWKGVEF